MEPCNQNIFKNGHSIATLDACMHRAEEFVKAVAEESEQPVDWHYSGGIANVLYLGDFDRVRDAFDKRIHMLSMPMKRVSGQCGSCSGDSHRAGRVFRMYEKSAHGPYRAGDELPEEIVAVSTTL